MADAKSLLDTWESDFKLSPTQRDFCLQLHERFQPHAALVTNNSSAMVDPNAPQHHQANSPLKKPHHQNSINELATITETVNSNTITESSNAVIENSQQFLKWFANIEVDMEREQEANYRAQLETISLYLEAVEELCQLIEEMLTVCKEMEQDYQFVQFKSSALQNDCERLLAEQQGLLATADQLAENLSYFNDLEKITKLFNAPGNEVCANEFFIPMLSRLDECLTFVQNNVSLLFNCKLNYLIVTSLVIKTRSYI
jgi:hypothetical protein